MAERTIAAAESRSLEIANHARWYSESRSLEIASLVRWT